MKNSTIARGYRLKASTHKLIKKVQMELNSSQDEVITKAIKLYYITIKNSNGNILNGNNLNGNNLSENNFNK